MILTILFTLRLEASVDTVVEIVNQLDKPLVLSSLTQKNESLAIKMKDTVLTVHCQSKDDDLGVHNISLNSKYTFQFLVEHYSFAVLSGHKNHTFTTWTFITLFFKE
ncbi:hypothetical protein Lalb_Chr11g0065381 [Lupinus albus]|uniref:Uncharacterized protein n=1 Tax=Lupinus albus TaxID=3870 RepID=A0A6A4PQG6_LUPAL|nr:hypothetical protein Lalb_Chr11g0065381 [Lupinus albus]